MPKKRDERSKDAEAVGVQDQPASQQARSQPKPLKFIIAGAPNPKRRRIGAACLTCRKRKTACSGERPRCRKCSENGLVCAGYDSNESGLHGSQVPKKDTSGFNRGDGAGSRVQERDGNLRGSEVDPTLSSASYIHPVLGQRRPLATASPPLDFAVSAESCLDFKRGSDSTQTQQDGSTGSSGGDGPLFSGRRDRMPYFRWLGPTAIMPGFKQMVVKVRRKDTEFRRTSVDGMAPEHDRRLHSSPSKAGITAADCEPPFCLPFYDSGDFPPHELITHLADTFFTRLGCNYPFLQRERFLRDLEEKKVDAILVDAVCAIAARFSTHPLIEQQKTDYADATPAENGHAFAQRAKRALVDTFACPTVAAVQSAILLAYTEFGESRDSGLWMYLGTGIRMAQDLGMHKIEGLKFVGRNGPTPRTIKRESLSDGTNQAWLLRAAVRGATAIPSSAQATGNDQSESAATANVQTDVEEQRAAEQERIDTLWAVFFLDRMVSSGTGRPCTLRDDEIEVSFPSPNEMASLGWPCVFPELIRIVHLYGRVADLLNGIKEPADITPETPEKLASMESQVTSFYQGLSPKLHFDAVNFQYYVKAGEVTTFILLHLWFHALIVLLNRPTLLKTFEGRMLQLFPNSRQLSMSSAKTIADILSYSQIMNAKAILGNPFTSQPIYIAACAFLKETEQQVALSNPQSRCSSPPRTKDTTSSSLEALSPQRRDLLSIMDLTTPRSSTVATPLGASTGVPPASEHAQDTLRQKEVSKLPTGKIGNGLPNHPSLATVANQHYLLCYKALQSLEAYWAGAKYILTVLDQKHEGIGDPLLYTMEESASAIERPWPEPAFTSPGWRGKWSGAPLSHNSIIDGQTFRAGENMQTPQESAGEITRAIGWTLTGSTNSSNTNLAWHYPTMGPNKNTQQSAAVSQNGHSSERAAATRIYEQRGGTHVHSNLQPVPGLPNQSSAGSTHDAHPSKGITQHGTSHSLARTNKNNHEHDHPVPQASSATHQDFSFFSGHPNTWPPFNSPWLFAPDFDINVNDHDLQAFGDVTIQSQDVDMSILGLDMMPWFDSFHTS